MTRDELDPQPHGGSLKRRRKDDEPHVPPDRPAPYPLDTALEEAHTGLDTDTEQPSRSAGQARPDSWLLDADRAEQPATDPDGHGHQHGHELQVTGMRQPPTPHAPAHDDPAPPQSVADRLARLRPWQATYVLALMECGGIVELACRKCRVSRESVEAWQAREPEFAQACTTAIRGTTDLVEAACYRGATIGDTAPVYQGGLLVGYKRVRNTRDAELLLKLRGRLGQDDQQATATAAIPVTALPQLVSGIAERLFAARAGQLRPPIDV